MAKTKIKAKTGLSKLNKALFIIFIILLVATILIVALSPAKVPVKPAEEAGEFEDVAVIDEFVPGTYGGVEFTSVEDVANYYVECFNYTKTLTAPYTDNGEAKNYYKLLGDENLEVKELLIEGKANSTINSLVPGILGSLFNGHPKGLPPAAEADPLTDYRDDGTIQQQVSHFTAEDILACNIVDNGGGTITMTIQPKYVILSMADQDAQGRFFNVLGDITGTVSQISVLSFSQGDANDNITVRYAGGTGTVTIDTATKEITAADYVMKVHLDVTHANVTVIKDKSATMELEYTNHFPADDEWLAEKGVTRN